MLTGEPSFASNLLLCVFGLSSIGLCLCLIVCVSMVYHCLTCDSTCLVMVFVVSCAC